MRKAPQAAEIESSGAIRALPQDRTVEGDPLRPPAGCRRVLPWMSLSLLAAWACLVLPAIAMTADSDLCDLAAETAAAETGVPLSLLRAVARTESGRSATGDPEADAQPWPWTIRHGGSGDWLDSRAAALARAEELAAAGETNVDLGCFQINLHWHGAAFPSLDAMLDPTENARYAARHLAELFARTGDWRAATGAYHSGDPERAAAYAERVKASHARRLTATAATPDPDPAPPAATIARFGLSPANGTMLTAARGPLIGGP